MSVSTILFTPFLSFTPLSQPDNTIQIFTDIDVSGYAQNNEIYPLIKGKPGQYSTSEHAYTLNKAEAGFVRGELSFSLFSRYEWYLNFSPDAMQLYGESVNGQDMQAGKVYDVDLNVEHLVSNGIKFGWSHDWNKQLSSYVSVSYLEGREVMSGRLYGHVQHFQGHDYNGLLNLNYIYSDDVLLDRKVEGQRSHFGYSSDVGVNWMPTEQWLLSLWAQDLLALLNGKMHHARVRQQTPQRQKPMVTGLFRFDLRLQAKKTTQIILRIYLPNIIAESLTCLMIQP